VPPLSQSDKSAPVAEAAKRLRATDPCKVVPGLSGKSLGSVWAGLLSAKRPGAPAGARHTGRYAERHRAGRQRRRAF
jgi:hypothetical protein